jgi:hypothetical protein
MKQTWRGYFAFCIEAKGAQISIVPFPPDGPSTGNGHLTGDNSTQGGAR